MSICEIFAVRLLITDVPNFLVHTLQLTATETIMSHDYNQDKASNKLSQGINRLFESFCFKGSRISSAANLYAENLCQVNIMLLAGISKYKTRICETRVAVLEKMDYLFNSEISFHWSLNLQKTSN